MSENLLDYKIRPVTDDDRDAVSSIYNYYVKNSFAAYPENTGDRDYFEAFRNMTAGYPFYIAEITDREIVGFAFIHDYSRISTFNRAAEITYFILPDYTGKGIGKHLLNILTEKAREMGIETLLACISSRNQPSINFHRKNGFYECGRFVKVGRKFSEDFDLVWMQKFI